MSQDTTLHTQLVDDERFKDVFKDVTIYGVAGANGSGKDTVLDVLLQNGFYVFNTGDSLRQISTAVMGTTQRGGNSSPTGMIANQQRSLYPGGMVTVGMIEYWSRVLHMPENLHPKGLAIGSIRSVSEVQALQSMGGKLIVVAADAHVRYERVVGRGRAYEGAISFEQFDAEDKAEMGYGETDPTKFGMAQVIEMADISIDNSTDNIDDFRSLIGKTLNLSNDG